MQATDSGAAVGVPRRGPATVGRCARTWGDRNGPSAWPCRFRTRGHVSGRYRRQRTAAAVRIPTWRKPRRRLADGCPTCPTPCPGRRGGCRSPVAISLPSVIQVNICSQAFLALSSALSEVSEFVMPSEWHVSPTEPWSRAVAPLVQTNGARSGGQMVVSWTLFRAASQESGLSGLEIGARPDEAVTRFETGSAIETRVNQDRAPTCMSGNEDLRYTKTARTWQNSGTVKQPVSAPMSRSWVFA